MNNLEIYRPDENHFTVQYTISTTIENLQEACSKKLQSMGINSSTHYLAITTAKSYKDKTFYNTRKLSLTDKFMEIKQSYSLAFQPKIYLLDANVPERKKPLDSPTKESELTYEKIKLREKWERKGFMIKCTNDNSTMQVICCLDEERFYYYTEKVPKVKVIILNSCVPEKIISEKDKKYKLSLKADQHRARIFLVKQKDDLDGWFNSIANIIACQKAKQTSEEYDKYIAEKEKHITNYEGEIISNYYSLYTLLTFPDFKSALDQTLLSTTYFWQLITHIFEYKALFSKEINSEAIKCSASKIMEEIKKLQTTYDDYESVFPKIELSIVQQSISDKIYKTTMYDKIIEKILSKEYSIDKLKEHKIPLTTTNQINISLLKTKTLNKVQFGVLPTPKSHMTRANTTRYSEGISPSYMNKTNPAMFRSGASYTPYYDK